MSLENLSKNYKETEGERKNSNVFWSGDFGYTKDKLYKDKLYLKCRFFTRMNCKGRAFIHKDKPQVTTVHSYSSRETDFEVLLAKSTMKKKAEATSEDLHLIFQNTLCEFPAVVSESVIFRQIIPSLQKRRRLNEPSKSPNEAAEVLNDKECHRYGDIFLGSVAEQDNVALLFGHMLVIYKAKSAKVCFVDGTFSMTPRMEESKWYQLLIFSVEYSAVLEDPIPDEDQMNFDPDNPHLWGISVPAVCALMTSKSEALYKLVFSKIKEVLDFSPVTIMSDFERGLQNALKTTWSESLVNGCRYKLLLCYYLQLAILGLQREYHHQIQVKKWAQKVSALCLLSANKILVAWGSRVIEIAQFSREIKIKLLAFKSALDENSMNEVGESLPLQISTSTVSPKCVVCTVNKQNALVMPCRHFLFCQLCIQQVQKSNTAHCPTCRGLISSIIEPFQ
ncbi:uncharacterized protein LOC136096834 [Hydra vulgaris]|uniref:uncharacterized protein LOC136096834 n=1 Tax=Hydra vulgaris TaxID=6087 RepID=UPI0032EA3EBE